MNKQRDWKMISQANRVFHDMHHQGELTQVNGVLGFSPPETWHALDCPEYNTMANMVKVGFNSLHCPSCNLRFSVFVTRSKNGRVDFSAHRQFDYSLAAQQKVEQMFAAAHKPVVTGNLNSLGDMLAPLLQQRTQHIEVTQFSNLVESILCASTEFKQACLEMRA